MPNHVTNIINFNCDPSRSDEIMKFLQAEDDVYGSIDFNKLIPMPEDLNISSGSFTSDGIDIYLTAVNPATVDYGYYKMDYASFLNIYLKLKAQDACNMYKPALSEEEIQIRTKYNTFEELFKAGEQAISNLKLYGAITWYEWCIQHWGTKWNAYDCIEMKPGDNRMIFLTAWDAIPDIVQKISALFPDVPIDYSWADEDVGSNTGSMEFLNGEIISEDIPENGSKEALELACDILGYDISEMEVDK